MIGGMAGGAYMFMKNKNSGEAELPEDDTSALNDENDGQMEGGDNELGHKLLVEDDRISLLGRYASYKNFYN